MGREGLAGGGGGGEGVHVPGLLGSPCSLPPSLEGDSDMQCVL